MRWVSSQPQATEFMPEKLTRISPIGKTPDLTSIQAPDFWKSPSTNKLLALRFPLNFGPDLDLNPSKSIVLGGMCLLTTIDMKRIYRKEISFESVNDFAQWFLSWYPRIDQIHDTVGVPPKSIPKVIYATEDSFFADRISSYTGLPKDGVQSVLRDVHEQQAHPILERYLRNQGYKGEVSTIYTSDVEEELELATSIWERMLGIKFRGGDRNFAKVELMYTGIWLDILRLQNSASNYEAGVIFEAASKMILKGWLKLEEWFSQQAYGEGANRNLGIAGYLPFITLQGDSSVLSYSDVPNFSNFKTHEIPDSEMPWYVANMLFTKKSVVDNGPLFLSNKDAAYMIRSDLFQYYEK